MGRDPNGPGPEWARIRMGQDPREPGPEWALSRTLSRPIFQLYSQTEMTTLKQIEATLQVEEALITQRRPFAGRVGNCVYR